MEYGRPPHVVHCLRRSLSQFLRFVSPAQNFCYAETCILVLGIHSRLNALMLHTFLVERMSRKKTYRQRNTAQHAQHRTTQDNTAQDNTAQYSTTQDNTAPHSTIRHNMDNG